MVSAPSNGGERWVSLTELTRPVGRADPQKTPSTTFSYIDISAIDSETKRVVSPQRVLGIDAPSRARQPVRAGDILVSTVRPNLNAVALLDESHEGSVASTGFCVLRPDPAVLDASYAFHWVRTPQFVGELMQQATGASYPAVTDKVVKRTAIRLPPVEEQRRLAGVLDSADELRTARRQASARLSMLTEAIFVDMFERHGWDHWPAVAIEAIARPARGSIRTGPFGSQLLHEEFTDEGIAVLGIDNAVHNEFRWGERRYISPEKYEALKRFTVHPGDVIVTIMGTCGRAAVIPDDIPVAINTKHLCCITLDPSLCDPVWLWACLRFHPGVQRQLGATHGAVMPGLNMGRIKQAEIPLPPVDVQQSFVAAKLVVDLQTSNMRMSAAKFDDLFASLQQRAFRGDL